MPLLPILILWIIVTIVLITGWSALPILLFALFPTRIRSRFLDESAAQKLMAAHPLQMETVAELKALGFDMMGVRIEQLPLWGMQLPAIALVSAESRTYASVLFSARQKPVGIYFFTPLKSGGMVFTRNQEQQPEFESALESVKNVPGVPISAVYAAHLSRLRSRSVAEAALWDVNPQENRHTAARLFYATTYGRKQVRKYLTTRPVRNFALAVLLLILFYGFWLLPAAR